MGNPQCDFLKFKARLWKPFNDWTDVGWSELAIHYENLRYSLNRMLRALLKYHESDGIVNESLRLLHVSIWIYAVFK